MSFVASIYQEKPVPDSNLPGLVIRRESPLLHSCSKRPFRHWTLAGFLRPCLICRVQFPLRGLPGLARGRPFFKEWREPVLGCPVLRDSCPDGIRRPESCPLPFEASPYHPGEDPGPLLRSPEPVAERLIPPLLRDGLREWNNEEAPPHRPAGGSDMRPVIALQPKLEGRGKFEALAEQETRLRLILPGKDLN